MINLLLRILLIGARLSRNHDRNPARSLDCAVASGEKAATLRTHLPCSVDDLVEIIRQCLAVEALDDGVSFDTMGVKGEPITLDKKYHGVRIRARGQLGNARLSLQLDFGFGDVNAGRIWRQEAIPVWAGQPLESYETAPKLIRRTKTDTGLRVRAYLDKTFYQTKLKLSAEQKARINLRLWRVLPKWNYTIEPQPPGS